MASDTIKAVLNWQSADFWEAVAKFDTYNIDFVVQSEDAWYEAVLVRSVVVWLHLVPRAATPGRALPAMIAAPNWLCDLRERPPAHEQSLSRLLGDGRGSTGLPVLCQGLVRCQSPSPADR